MVMRRIDYCNYCGATVFPEESAHSQRIWSNTSGGFTVLQGQLFTLGNETHFGCTLCMGNRIKTALAEGKKIIRFQENTQPNPYSCVAAAFASVMGWPMRRSHRTRPAIREAEALNDTARGAKGFGSTGR